MNLNPRMAGARWLTALGFLAALNFAGAAASLTPEQQSWLDRSWRFARAGWIYVHVEGGPRERGFQHGYRLAPEIADSLRVQRALWQREGGPDWPWLVEQARAMFEPKLDPELLAELDGLAEGLQAAGIATSRAELITYNGWFELAWYWWPKHRKEAESPATKPARESCSSFIATGSATADGGVVLGHNSMVDYPEATANVIMDILPARGHRILWQCWPGWLHSGTDFFVTDAGLVGSETTLGSFEGFDESGVPEFARMRRATQDADSIDAWCELMKRGNNGGYANAWLVGDVRSGEIARLELGLKHVGLERKRDGWFLGSNIAEDLKILRNETSANENDIRVSNVARRERWRQLMREHRGKIDLERAKRFEADHYDVWLAKTQPGSRSLCGHTELDRDPRGPWPGAPFYPAGTFDGKVVDAPLAKSMAFAARWGAACGRPFEAARFLREHPQFDWMEGLLQDRRSEPWAVFRAGEKP